MSQPRSLVYIMQVFLMSVYIHIGVGSNVVCSTGLGNARAAVSGTDDRQFPRLFMLVTYAT